VKNNAIKLYSFVKIIGFPSHIQFIYLFLFCLEGNIDRTSGNFSPIFVLYLLMLPRKKTNI